MVKPGDPILKHITANWFNNLTNKTDRNIGGTALGQIGLQTILVQNHSTTAKNKYDAVALGDPVLDYDVPIGHIHNDIVFETKALTDSEPHNWVVLQEPLPGRVGASARAVLYGLTWLDLLDNDPGTDDFVKVVNGTPDLVLGAEDGKGYIHHVAYDDYNDNYLALITIGIPIASQDAITDIRVSGFALQYTKNGTDWTTWHTGDDCSS